MGSKQKLIPFIDSVVSRLPASSVFDAFAGSGVVAHYFKSRGMRVVANDLLRFNYLASAAMIENDSSRLTDQQIRQVSTPNPQAGTFIRDNFSGLYFTDDENAWLDNAIANIRELEDPQLRAVALTALCRACLKKRPRGLFTYVGFRYDDGRRDLRLSMEAQFRIAVAGVQAAIFRGKRRCTATNADTFDIRFPRTDLVYLDPPYMSRYSDNEYHRRYHFLEGLVSYWEGMPLQQTTITKKTLRRPSRFDARGNAEEVFRDLFGRCNRATILLSYSSNGVPDERRLRRLLQETDRRVRVFRHPHTYTFSTLGAQNSQNRVEELLFLAEPE